MMSAFSQEESVSISKNMHKGATMRMQNGTYKTSTPAYGYRNGPDGKLVIVPEEAEVVRYIYKSFLSGSGMNQILRELEKREVPKQYGKVLWIKHGILYILTNERYVGDELFQKFYSNGQIPFHRYKNYGALKKYYIQDTHEAIIDKSTFQQVQLLLKKKKARFSKAPSSQSSPLKGMLKCAYCGRNLHRKVRSGRVAWVCPTHYENAESCSLNNIPETKITRILSKCCGYTQK